MGAGPGLLAAALYGVAAFPIQQAHFWTVDAFTTFWVTLALYFAVRAMDDASVQQGPRPLLYLAIWAGAVVWDAALPAFPGVGTGRRWARSCCSCWSFWRRCGWSWRCWAGRSPDWLLAGAGVMASLIYLIGWSVVDGAAKHDFVIYDDLMSLGFVSLIFAMAVWVMAIAASIVHGSRSLGRDTARYGARAGGGVGHGRVDGAAAGLSRSAGCHPGRRCWSRWDRWRCWSSILTELTDYALFGIALGGAVASRINVAPLAGIIVVAALIKVLPALDPHVSIPRTGDACWLTR